MAKSVSCAIATQTPLICDKFIYTNPIQFVKIAPAKIADFFKKSAILQQITNHEQSLTFLKTCNIQETSNIKDNLHQSKVKSQMHNR
ncbi:MAG: hypothetical protein PUP91_08500 [Rhizonema sp. PD37]|nr:hypothetical protein [Rhizonema sp. PD37]